MENMCVQMTGIKQMQSKSCEMPVPAPGEITVNIQYVGICGSDMHFFTEGRIGKKVIDRPFILGHECAGIVTALGEGVTALCVGDRVALEPGVPCGRCEFCLSGRYNLCPNVHFMASPPYDGALRRYMTYPAFMAFRLPDGISTMEGAMIEPLSVGLHAARRGGVTLGKTVAVLGGGPIGIMTLLACKAMDATKLILTDLYEKRLENAKKLGADAVFHAASCDVVQAVLDATDGMGADVVFETAGSPVTMVQAAKVVKRGGVIVAVGNITKETPFDFLSIINREVEIRPVFRYRNIYPIAIEALASKKIDLGRVEPVLFAFEQTQEAFLYTLEHAERIIKTIIQIDS